MTEKSENLEQEQAEIEAAFAEIEGSESGADFEPKAALAEVEQQQQSAGDKLESAQMSAVLYTEILAGIVEHKFKGMDLTEGKPQVAEKLALVLVKYDAELPAWLVPFKEEIALGVTVASVGVSAYMQYQQQQQAAASDEKSESNA